MKLLLANLVIFAGTLAVAAEDGTIATAWNTNYRNYDTGPVGFAPFLGIGAGYTPKNDQNNIEGANSNIKLLGSFYPENQKSVFDLGYGAVNQQFSAAPSLGENKSITAGVLEYAGRYQWNNRWQAGLVGNTIFGRGAYYGANQSDAQFGGLQVIREITLPKGRLARVGARAMEDLNIDNQTVYQAMIDFQFGFGGYNRRDLARTDAGAQTTGATGPTPDTAVDTAPAPVIEDVDLKQVAGTASSFMFASGSAELRSQGKSRAQNIGALLAQHQDLFQSVEVIGYADQTGNHDANLALSENRAETVASVLESEGIEGSHIVATGKGPMGAPGDVQMSRRVEIRLIGVNDRSALEELFAAE